jgi:hypothetical protein
MFSRTYAAATRCGVAVLLFTSFAAIGITSTNNPTPVSAQERESVARRFTEEKLRTWQERLNLRDWNLRVQLVHPNALEPRTMGNIRWDTDTKEATISVLSSYDYKMPWLDMLDDMEFTVVHEMVHLHLASLPRSEASRRIEEHAVNELARALLNLAKH